MAKASSNSGDRWVTIGGRHILIKGGTKLVYSEGGKYKSVSAFDANRIANRMEKFERKAVVHAMLKSPQRSAQIMAKVKDAEFIRKAADKTYENEGRVKARRMTEKEKVAYANKRGDNVKTSKEAVAFRKANASTAAARERIRAVTSDTNTRDLYPESYRENMKTVKSDIQYLKSVFGKHYDKYMKS